MALLWGLDLEAPRIGAVFKLLFEVCPKGTMECWRNVHAVCTLQGFPLFFSRDKFIWVNCDPPPSKNQT